MSSTARLHAARRLVSMSELAAYLNHRWSPPLLYRWAKLGKMPSLKVNGSRAVDLDAIDAWLSAGMPANAAPCISKFREAKERLSRSLTTNATIARPDSQKGVS
jgi:hypothetical protein